MATTTQYQYFSKLDTQNFWKEDTISFSENKITQQTP